jgi:hypothetical protein
MGTRLLHWEVEVDEAQARSARARYAALKRHSRGDTHAATLAARRGFLRKFENEVDPDGVLDPIERQVRAGRALRAYMAALALRSAQVRSGRNGSRRGGNPRDGPL